MHLVTDSKALAMIPPLILRKLHLSNFRCHDNYQVDFSSGINLICGDNGSGKTSLLEAIYLMACGCSFRRSRVKDLVRWQESRYWVRGNWHRYGVIHVQASGNRSTTLIALQGRPINAKQDLHEHLALVVDSPQSERLIDGGARVRRRWMDRLMLTFMPSIGQSCHHYNRAMLQRSRLIRQGASLSQIIPWNVQMVTAGRAWIVARNRLLIAINSHLEKEHWANAVMQLSIKITASDCDQQWLENLQTTTGKLRIGPHCDTIALLRNGHEILLHGSHGQQKIMAVVLRLVESMLRAEARHIYPLLMLDDCFEALDQYWQQQVVARLQNYPGQVLLTAPDTAAFDSNGRQGCNRLIRLSSLEKTVDLKATTEVMLNGTGY